MGFGRHGIPDRAMYLINRLGSGKTERQRTSESKERWRLFSDWSLVRRFFIHVLFMKATKGKMMAKLRLKWDYGIFRRRKAKEQRNLGGDGGKDVESKIGATTARGRPMVIGLRELGPPFDAEPIPR